MTELLNSFYQKLRNPFFSKVTTFPLVVFLALFPLKIYGYFYGSVTLKFSLTVIIFGTIVFLLLSYTIVPFIVNTILFQNAFYYCLILEDLLCNSSGEAKKTTFFFAFCIAFWWFEFEWDLFALLSILSFYVHIKNQFFQKDLVYDEVKNIDCHRIQFSDIISLMDIVCFKVFHKNILLKVKKPYVFQTIGVRYFAGKPHWTDYLKFLQGVAAAAGVTAFINALERHNINKKNVDHEYPKALSETRERLLKVNHDLSEQRNFIGNLVEQNRKQINLSSVPSCKQELNPLQYAEFCHVMQASGKPVDQFLSSYDQFNGRVPKLIYEEYLKVKELERTSAMEIINLGLMTERQTIFQADLHTRSAIFYHDEAFMRVLIERFRHHSPDECLSIFTKFLELYGSPSFFSINSYYLFNSIKSYSSVDLLNEAFNQVDKELLEISIKTFSPENVEIYKKKRLNLEERDKMENLGLDKDNSPELSKADLKTPCIGDGKTRAPSILEDSFSAFSWLKETLSHFISWLFP